MSDSTTVTDDDATAAAPHHHVDIQVLCGKPTDEELAALVAVLAGAVGGGPDPAPPQRDLWGHPVDKLRYEVFSWQRVTLLERSRMRR